jgi:hypothetical protein
VRYGLCPYIFQTRFVFNGRFQSFQTGSSNGPSYFHIFLIAFLEEAFIRNIIVLGINYIIILYINSAVINNNYGILQDPLLPFKIPMGTRRDFSEIWARALQKVRQPCTIVLNAEK